MAASTTGREQDSVQRPASRSQHNKRNLRFTRHGAVNSEDALGQFSFGPTTQTTVVTTTTTTTTNFPPFLLRAPWQTGRLDPKLYPLAKAPTPSSLKNIRFTHQGRQTVFREAPDATMALDELQEAHEHLRKGNGTLQRVEQIQPDYQQDIVEHSSASSKTVSDIPASPSSINDDDDEEDEVVPAEYANRQSHRLKRREKQPAKIDHDPRPHRHLRNIQSINPLTPDTQPRQRRQSRRRSYRYADGIDRSGLEQLAVPSNSRFQHSMSPNLNDEFQHTTHRGSPGRSLASRASLDTAVPTPPIESEDDSISIRQPPSRALSSIPTHLHVSNSPSTHEGNLPSPSLSPVTAAAQAQPSGYFTDLESGSELPLHGAHLSRLSEPLFEEASSDAGYGSPAVTEPGDADMPFQEPRQAPELSITDFPAMFDYFETLPDELKSYVMHQLLRRCPKPTLHVVADTVNPALKCDFLSILPPELGLHIVSHLDVRSLCRAAQVSRKWRQIVNSDEKAWKELFDADGFSLPDGELQIAITQGWGWQDPYGIAGFEKDFSSDSILKAESEAESTCTVGSPGRNRSTVRRSKRKAAGMLSSNRNKQIKRQDASRELSADIDSIDWTALKSTPEGPYNAASAAILAVPNPKLPIPSLKGLHLYKSLYRRHHLIRRNWMSEETKPRHIAFRAHDSHVVTCLQFDTDKILTGSDDNNINVYDTKTGALRQLLKGHEGGVWALQYEGNTLVSGSTDRSVRVWDVERGEETHVFRGHTSTVRCLQILMPTKVGETSEGKPIMTPRYPLIITGSRDSTLRVWRLPRSGDEPFIQAESDAESDDCPYFIRTLTGHQHSVRAIAAHADTLVSGSYDCTVRVWKISTGETVHRLQGHSQKVYSVVLDHTRNRCISGSMDNLVKIWSLSTGAPLYTLEGHTSLVGLLDLNHDRLVSAAADSTLRIWDPENGQCKATLTAHTGAITCFQHDGQKVISGSDRTLKMWDIKTGECMKDLLSDLSGVWQVKFNDRRCVAAVQRDQMTYIEVLDFGASRDGIPDDQRGKRIVVDEFGREINNGAENLQALDEDQTSV